MEPAEGVRFAALVDVPCPDRATADQVLRDILDIARRMVAEIDGGAG